MSAADYASVMPVIIFYSYFKFVFLYFCTILCHNLMKPRIIIAALKDFSFLMAAVLLLL